MRGAPPPRQAAILVGGRGTRLGTLTDAVPKPLLSCGDRPFLAWVLRELSRFGIEEVLLLTGYLAERVEASLPEITRTLPKPLRIRCIREARPAGTGGALHNAGAHLADRFLLCNGDSWLDCNLQRLLADAAGDPAEVVGRMLLRRLDDTSRYGVVRTDGERVTAFSERPLAGAGASALPGTINAGVYVFDRRVLADIAPVCSLEREVLPALAARGALRGSVADGYFIDIGIPSDLVRAQTELPDRLRRRALFVSMRSAAVSGPVVTALRAAADAGWHVFLLADGPAAPPGAPQSPIALRETVAALRAAGAVVDDVCRAATPADNGPSAGPAAVGNAGRPTLAAVLAGWRLAADRCAVFGSPHDLSAAAAAGIPAQTIEGGNLAERITALLADGGARSG